MDQLGNMFNKYASGGNQNPNQNQGYPPTSGYPGGPEQQQQQMPHGQNAGGQGGFAGALGGFMNNLGGGQGGGQGGMHQGQGMQQQQQHQQQQGGFGGGSGGFLGGLGDRLQGAAGGGRESEKNEDYLDKGVDFVQERFLGQGPQNNESAIEQAKDEQISDFIRSKYKSTTGTDFPIKDKPNQFDKFGGR